MQAIRQIKQVSNGSITVQVPHGFSANKVEVIVLPVQPHDVESEFADLAALVESAMSVSGPEQESALRSILEVIAKGRTADEPRILGLFEGLVQVSDDFDAPLSDEGVFWGAASDQYGVSLNQ